jgi:hypothetical protein
MSKTRGFRSDSVAGAALLIGLTAWAQASGAGTRPGLIVADFHVFTAVCAASSDSDTPLIALRRFHLNGVDSLLTVDPASLRTVIVPAAGLRMDGLSLKEIRARFPATPYAKALRDAEANASVLQDAGITHFSGSQPGVDLTVDLCPSRFPMDRALFSELVKDLGAVETPVPLAVAVTGVWMDRHPGDLDWLAGLETSGAISVTWINHSFHHRTSPDLPLKENFLLEKGTDLDAEVLKTEIRMIERGILPSIFFRFPGLVSDQALVRAVTETYGLIPVGSDAWLAKNQKPGAGSIILVHANGNDPLGVRAFLRLLRKERAEIAGRKWLLYDLRDSAVELEK